MHTAFAGAEEEKREWRKGDAHARCLESLQRDNWEHLAETSGDVSGAGGMGIYALQHFGGGGEAKSLSAWWQQTAGVRALVRGGIPAERRGQLWFELSGAAQKQAAAVAAHGAELSASHSEAERQWRRQVMFLLNFTLSFKNNFTY